MTGTGGERLFRKSFQVEKLGTPHPRPRVSSQAGGESLSPRLSYGVRVQGREARSEGQEKKGGRDGFGEHQDFIKYEGTEAENHNNHGRTKKVL